ncbi:MAG: Nif3-like dinuclear metal center hexameric protein [Verrucomicrobiales bacterium]
MVKLADVVSAANDWLHLDEIPDYPQALNGLQLENGGEVKKIVAAVDACLPVIERACERGADLLVVHHGLFWQGAQRIEGPVYRKLKTAMGHDLAIYSAHIPLDVHPELGNNAQLVRALDLGAAPEPFFEWKGIELGLRVETEISRDDLLARVERATGTTPQLCPGGPEAVRKLGVITGGAGGEIAAIAETGVDTFLTGEGPHWSYTAAEELGINLIYGGHYATETFGVKALAQRWCAEFEGLEWDFIDHPTGL